MSSNFGGISRDFADLGGNNGYMNEDPKCTFIGMHCWAFLRYGVYKTTIIIQCAKIAISGSIGETISQTVSNTKLLL